MFAPISLTKCLCSVTVVSERTRSANCPLSPRFAALDVSRLNSLVSI